MEQREPLPMRSGGRAPTLDHVWIAVALILLALRPLLMPIPPHDFWWHMATGRIIATEHVIPSNDTFSYTRTGVPFYNQGWLAQLLLYWLHQLGGVQIILLIQALVITLAYGLLLRLCFRRCGRLRLAIALLLLTTFPLSFDNWNVRPQSYALPFFVGFLTLLTEYRLLQINRLWLLPPLMMLWVNIHGTFILGLGLIGFTFAGEMLKAIGRRTLGQSPIAAALAWATSQGKPLLLWGAVTTLAMLINPRGPGVLGYVRNLLSSSAVTTLVTEWASPTIRDTNGVIFFLFIIGLMVLLAYSRQSPDLTDIIMLLPFFWLALGAVRNIIWFGMVATPIIVVQAASLLPAKRSARKNPGARLLNAILIGMLGILLLIGMPWLKPDLLPPPYGALLTPSTPVQAVEALRSLPNRPKRLFHDMSYGSYLIWAAPEQPVFIDPRIELYPYDQWRDYINLTQGNNLTTLLRTYDIDGFLLDKKEQKTLIDALQRDPASSWSVRYQDEHTIYLTYP